MPERYSTLGENTLASAYTSGDTTLELGDSSSFPSAGVFRVRVDDEILKVTANNTGTNVLTVVGAQEGTGAANHLSGATCTGVLTSVALDKIREDIGGIGVLASLPSTSDAKKGDRYDPIDGNYRYVFNGTVWVPFLGSQAVLAPVLADFALAGSGTGTGTAVDTTGGILFTMPKSAASGDNVKFLIKTPALSPSYTIIACFRRVPVYYGGNNFCGLCLRESSTQRALSYGYRSTSLVCITISNDTSWSGGTAIGGPQPFDTWVKIQNDGTNLKFFVGAGRYNMIQLAAYDQVITSRFTTAPDQVGFAVETEDTAVDESMLILHFEELAGLV